MALNDLAGKGVHAEVSPEEVDQAILETYLVIRRDLARRRTGVTRRYGPGSPSEVGWFKNEYGVTPLRVRGRERVALHADLTMVARLSLALARARAVPLAA